MATKKAIKEVQEKAEKHHKNRVDQLFTMFKSHGEMLADHIGYINDINKRIDELESELNQSKALITTMRGRMGV